MVDVSEQVRERFDVDYDFIEHLNGECLAWAGMDGTALQRALQAQGDTWYALVKERCPHLFSVAPLFISATQLQQMRQVIEAVECAVRLPAWTDAAPVKTPGVFYGYDFHLNAQGAHLIEINTNAGGGFLNALLIGSQADSGLYGESVGVAKPEQALVDMFRNEWRRMRGDEPLTTIAIVDEQPEAQYLYPEFLLAKKLFEQAGIRVMVADPEALQAAEGGLSCEGVSVGMIYNRLTDFSLQHFPHIRRAWEQRQVVLTPAPDHYQRYADKRRLVQLTDAEWLRGAGLAQAHIDVLMHGVPETRQVRPEDAELWWGERKGWFFKPVSGYGSKGAYRGDKVTKRVFEEIVQSEYIAQRLALPGERKVCAEGMESQMLKYDVRCFVYEGQIQLLAARLYQGQTTNFRTPGGGFALIRQII